MLDCVDRDPRVLGGDSRADYYALLLLATGVSATAVQRLVIAHEAEHVAARDTLVLGIACVVVAAMPWNPVVWYMLSRLRLAVELDCDARVLRAGAAPLSYGALLIDVAENN
ncbi:MAG: M56 family metallopeptidase, partial [Solirubrobacteraceae bacterium]